MDKLMIILTTFILTLLGCSQNSQVASKTGVTENIPYFKGKIPSLSVASSDTRSKTYYFNMDLNLDEFLKKFRKEATDKGYEETTLPNGVISFKRKSEVNNSEGVRYYISFDRNKHVDIKSQAEKQSDFYKSDGFVAATNIYKIKN